MLYVISAIDRPKSVPQLPYKSNVHFYLQNPNFQHISDLSYFNVVILYKSVSFDSWLDFNI